MDQLENESQQPNIPRETQPATQPEIPQKQGMPTWVSVLIMVVSIIIISIVTCGIYYYLNSEVVEENIVTELEPELEIESDKLRRIIDLDIGEFRSEKHGFSIELFTTTYPGEKDYYPIKALEWEGGILFSLEHHLMSDELLNEDPENNVSERHFWNIAVKDVNSEKELLDFVKERNGDACVISEKTLNQNNIYDVDINCSTHSMSYIVKYSPQYKKAATWQLGSDSLFFSEQGESFLSDPLDRKIVDTFKFIP